MSFKTRFRHFILPLCALPLLLQSLPLMILLFPPGALYSRKFTIDGEQISLQVQDTPFVSLEVTHLLSALLTTLQHSYCLLFVASTLIC